MNSAAPLPLFIDSTERKNLASLIFVAVGVGLMSLLAQIKVHLPYTPVPITGQTFGVAVIALTWGRRLGLSVILAYLALGFLGAPIFAGASGLSFGPTFGYLVGMCVASFVMGSLADRGWTKSFLKAWLAGALGSLYVFAFGLRILGVFVPKAELVYVGLLPFLPGDLIKTVLAAALASQAARRLHKH